MSSTKKMTLMSIKDINMLEAFKLMPGHIYWKDTDGFYLGCNEEQAEDFGLKSCEEVIGKSDYDLLPQDIAEKCRKNDLKVMKSGVPLTIEEEGYISKKIPLYNEANKVIGLLGVSISFKTYNDHMKNNISVLDKIVAAMPGHVYWKNTDCILQGCNDQQAIDVGLKSRHEIVGKNAYDLINKDLPEEVKRAHAAETDRIDKEIMALGKSSLHEEFVVRLDGTEAIYLSEKKPLYDDSGKLIGLLGISFDITERKELEEKLKRANELAESAIAIKTEFIENMQHDIRTPISGIYSLLESAHRSGNIEELKSYLPHLVNASRELLDIHNEVIDFDNIEYGDKPVYEKKFSLLSLLHGIIRVNSAAALAHATTLSLEVNNDVPDVVKGDDYRLKKILLNLVGNAIKFTEKGKVVLRVALLKLKDKQAAIRFSVEDNGIGIPEEKLPTIFEKFTKLNPSSRGKFKGSGLGLHIVKKFVTELGAELDVNSVVNEGSIFTVDVVFELPIAELLAGESTHKEVDRVILVDTAQIEIDAVTTPTLTSTTSKATHSSPLTSKTDVIRICLIEDNIMAMIAAENILRNTHYSFQMEKAISVAEALEVLKKQTFDLVICDLGLPDGSGFDIITQIKANKKHKNYQTPFVALTAHSDDARKEQAKKLGFLGFYNKPMTEDMANKMLAEHISQKTNAPEIIDIDAMADMFGGNVQTALKMVTILVSSFKEERILFKDAFICNDYTRARALFHKFRGGVSYIMAPTLSKVALLLHDEVKVFEKEEKPLTDLMGQLNNLFKAVDDIEAWLKSYKAE